MPLFVRLSTTGRGAAVTSWGSGRHWSVRGCAARAPARHARERDALRGGAGGAEGAGDRRARAPPLSVGGSPVYREAMPIPHQEMRRMKRRHPRHRGRRAHPPPRGLLGELPGYPNGPYGELRKWVQGLIEESGVRRAAKRREAFHVPKEGCAQVVLVGPANAGKSTLLRELTRRPVAVGDYRFTTLHPAAGVVDIGGAPSTGRPARTGGGGAGGGGGRADAAGLRAGRRRPALLPARRAGGACRGSGGGGGGAGRRDRPPRRRADHQGGPARTAGGRPRRARVCQAPIATAPAPTARRWPT